MTPVRKSANRMNDPSIIMPGSNRRCAMRESWMRMKTTVSAPTVTPNGKSLCRHFNQPLKLSSTLPSSIEIKILQCYKSNLPWRSQAHLALYLHELRKYPKFQTPGEQHDDCPYVELYVRPEILLPYNDGMVYHRAGGHVVGWIFEFRLAEL